jgi:hypothetical protein
MTDKERAQLERISAYLKRRFPNLTVEETLTITLDLMEILHD